MVALPANADDIVERLGERATLVAAADAGHALLPEQPEAVADGSGDRYSVSLAAPTSFDPSRVV